MAFNLGRVIDGEDRLRRDFIEFSRLWLAVREDWLDQRREQFEREHLSTLGPSLNRFTTALHELCDAIRKADQQLKDDLQPSDQLD
ncbi:MAG: hypothetical protein MI861_04570 [Pirellulales bacterium]|nr:hypothetical protein [Pirellulales bacterium]